MFNLSLLSTLITILFQFNNGFAEISSCGLVDASRSVVHLNENLERDIWSLEQAQNLSFCISPNFRNNYKNIEQAARAAANEWMKHANINFQLQSDLNCRTMQRDNLFEIVPTARQAKFKARAFFPGDERRKIQINRRYASEPPKEMLRLMLHELGHVLGLRHEHIHPDSLGDCPEISEAEAITEYDPLSVMHYAKCGEATGINYVLSELDQLGVSLLYPF